MTHNTWVQITTNTHAAILRGAMTVVWRNMLQKYPQITAEIVLFPFPPAWFSTPSGTLLFLSCPTRGGKPGGWAGKKPPFCDDLRASSSNVAYAPFAASYSLFVLFQGRLYLYGSGRRGENPYEKAPYIHMYILVASRTNRRTFGLAPRIHCHVWCHPVKRVRLFRNIMIEHSS